MATVETVVTATCATSTEVTEVKNYLTAHLADANRWTITPDTVNLKVTASLTVEGMTLK